MQTDINACARCGGNHQNLDLLPLDNHDKFTHYTICPVTSQPIMIVMKEG